jgi:hypothetical protein
MYGLTSEAMLGIGAAMEGPSCGAAFLAGVTAALHSEKDCQKKKDKVSDKIAGV